jgi:hypothetical protein
MRVRSLRDHYDGSYRKAGDEFEYTGKLHEHIEKVKPGQAQEAEPQDGTEPAAE